jgi:hypothetical protein
LRFRTQFSDILPYSFTEWEMNWGRSQESGVRSQEKAGGRDEREMEETRGTREIGEVGEMREMGEVGEIGDLR